MGDLFFICIGLVVSAGLIVVACLRLAASNGKQEKFEYDAESWKNASPDWDKDDDFPLGVGC